MNNIILFSFEKHQIRVIAGDNGEPLFVGKDICLALGYADPTTAMRSHCKGVQKLHPLQTEGGVQALRVIEEPDMMRLVVNSQLPSAQAFEALVFETILPTIRKTGAYLPEGITLESLPPSIASQVGGIIKTVVHKQIENLLSVELPRLVQSELAKQQVGVRYGVTAGQVWKLHKLDKLKNGPQILSRLLSTFGCEIDGGGKSEQGGRTAKMFDPDKADKAMKSGLLEHCLKHIKERKGQSNLFNLKAAR